MDVAFTNFYKEAPKKRIGICLFNRATYARCKVLLEELAAYPNIELVCFLSSSLLWSKFGEAAKYIERDHKNVKMVRVPVDPAPGTHDGIARCAGTIALSLVEPLHRERLHAVILVADRFETLSASLSALCLGIPIIHIQGGEITGCIDDKVRNALTKIADYHFPATRLAKEYLVQMGEDTKRIFQVGCPSLDLIRRIRVKRTYPKERYILAIFHPDTESSSQAYKQTKTVMEAVLDYCREYQHRCYWYYPNPDPGREEIIRYLDTTLKEWPAVFVRAVNQEPEDFLLQLGGARVVVGNSSCGLRECSYLGIPAVNVGDRQRSRERAFNVVDVGFDHDTILAALKNQHSIRRYMRSQLYGSGNASQSIARYVQHIDFKLKGPLTYPTWQKFKEHHFGEDRNHGHKRRLATTVGESARRKRESERGGDPEGSESAQGSQGQPEAL